MQLSSSPSRKSDMKQQHNILLIFKIKHSHKEGQIPALLPVTCLEHFVVRITAVGRDSVIMAGTPRPHESSCSAVLHSEHSRCSCNVCAGCVGARGQRSASLSALWTDVLTVITSSLSPEIHRKHDPLTADDRRPEDDDNVTLTS